MAALFRSQFASGFPGGRSKEQDCTIAADESGRFHAVSPGGLNRGESHFEPDLEMRQEELYVLGAFHTHPHDASAHNVSGVSLSGGDIVALVNIFLILAVVQSGTRPFAFVRARLTPRHVPPNLTKMWRAISGSGAAKPFNGRAIPLPKRWPFGTTWPITGVRAAYSRGSRVGARRAAVDRGGRVRQGWRA